MRRALTLFVTAGALVGCAAPQAVAPRPTPAEEARAAATEARKNRSAFEIVQACEAPRDRPMPRATNSGLDTTRPGWAWDVPGELGNIGSAMVGLTVGMFGMMARLAECELASLSTGLILAPLASARPGFYALRGHELVGVYVERDGDVTWATWFFEGAEQAWCFRLKGRLVVGGKCGAEPNLRAYRSLDSSGVVTATRGGVLLLLP